MAEAALAAGVGSFVFTSTIDVFAWPTTPGATFDESAVAATPKHTHYERSKQEADRTVTDLIAKGLPARFVAPAGVFGPAPAITPGANHLIRRLLLNQIPISLPGGLPVVYAPDVADLHVRAETAPVGSRYIASDQYLTLEAFAHAVAAIEPSAKVPRTLPVAAAKVIAVVGEAVSKLTAPCSAAHHRGAELPHGQRAARCIQGQARAGLDRHPVPRGPRHHHRAPPPAPPHLGTAHRRQRG